MPKFKRRDFLKALGLGTAAGIMAPSIWRQNPAYAQTAIRGEVEHLIYFHLRGGFRFTAAFNGDNDSEYNPFGLADNIPTGTEWGPTQLLEADDWLTEERIALGMQNVVTFANEMAVVPCIDHEPLAARADGNHTSGLERYLTGFSGGATSFFTMLNYGLQDYYDQQVMMGNVVLPAFSFGSTGMALGSGQYAPFRPPVLQGDGFDDFGFDASTLPAWASQLADEGDIRFRDGLNSRHQGNVDAYLQSRETNEEFAAIFNDPLLKLSLGANDVVDGISNAELNQMFDGTGGTGRNMALALRLFHFGSRAVFVQHGGYDYHSDENVRLSEKMAELNQVLSAMRASLKRMTHPKGGSYWDKTLIVLGSEFGRTTRGSRFNSAGGSDHGGDLATRWMSMPMMGGVVDATGVGGRMFGQTRSDDLEAIGQVYSYRSMMKTLMDALGCNHAEFFQADEPITDFFG